MSAIELSGVSVFYGEVIGLSKVDLAIDSGITGIVATGVCVARKAIRPNGGTCCIGYQIALLILHIVLCGDYYYQKWDHAQRQECDNEQHRYCVMILIPFFSMSTHCLNLHIV